MRRKQRAVFTKRLKVASTQGFHPERRPTLDDIVFLPANLSRLVIDPYRDACNVKTTLGAGHELAAPFLVTGFDEVPEEVREGVARGIQAQGLAYVGRRSLGAGVPWLQVRRGWETSPTGGRTGGDPAVAGRRDVRPIRCEGAATGS